MDVERASTTGISSACLGAGLRGGEGYAVCVCATASSDTGGPSIGGSFDVESSMVGVVVTDEDAEESTENWERAETLEMVEGAGDGERSRARPCSGRGSGRVTFLIRSPSDRRALPAKSVIRRPFSDLRLSADGLGASSASVSEPESCIKLKAEAEGVRGTTDGLEASEFALAGGGEWGTRRERREM